MWGSDFSHQSGNTYDTLDNIIQSINDSITEQPELETKYEIGYSTMTRYFESVFEEAKSRNVVFQKE